MNRKMKDSRIEWLGEIPFSWNLTKYKYFATSGMGSTLLKKDILIKQEEDSVPIYSATQTDKHFGYLKNPSIVLGKGDLIIPARGNSIGNTKIINQGNATCTQTTIYSKVNDRINSKFLYYCSKGLQKYWFFYVQTAIPQITVGEVQNNLVPYPSNLEQGKIVNFLDKKTSEIDNILEKTRQSIEELKAYKQSLITETVTKGLNPDVPMKDSEIEWIGQIPKNWTTIKIKYIGNAKNGLTYKPNELVDKNQGITILRSGNIQNGKLVSNNDYYVTSEIVTDNFILEKDDILICSRNGSKKLIGKNALIEETNKYTFGAFMMRFRPYKNQINGKYLYYILNSEVFSYYLGSFLTSTISQLTIGNFNNMNIVISNSLSEQEEIVNYLDKQTKEIDNLITKKQKMLKELESYKQSLIYEYVTGKKEVE